jgi:hypothetical protein
VHRDGKVRVGCRVCPPFEASARTGAEVVVDPSPHDEFYELEAVFDGDFTEPGRPQIAAVFSGCESHADNWGGTLLAERSGSSWVQKSYRSGFHPASCKTFRKPNAQELLLCLWETDHQSSVHWLLDTYDFILGDGDHPEMGWDNVLTVDDDSVAGCWEPASPRTSITADKILGFVVQPGTSQSSPQLVVTVRFARGAMTPAYRAACANLGERRQAVDLGATLQQQTRDLVFVWNGRGFVADASTKQTMIQFGM